MSNAAEPWTEVLSPIIQVDWLCVATYGILVSFELTVWWTIISYVLKLLT